MRSTLKVVLLRVLWSLTLGAAIAFTTIASLMTSFLSWTANQFGKLQVLSGKKLAELGKSAD